MSALKLCIKRIYCIRVWCT